MPFPSLSLALPTRMAFHRNHITSSICSRKNNHFAIALFSLPRSTCFLLFFFDIPQPFEFGAKFLNKLLEKKCLMLRWSKKNIKSDNISQKKLHDQSQCSTTFAVD